MKEKLNMGTFEGTYEINSRNAFIDRVPYTVDCRGESEAKKQVQEKIDNHIAFLYEKFEKLPDKMVRDRPNYVGHIVYMDERRWVLMSVIIKEQQ